MAIIRPTKDDSRRITRTVERVERMPANEPPPTRRHDPGTIQVHRIKVDDPATKTAGRYAAKRFEYSANARTWTEKEACWLDPVNEEQLEGRESIYWPAQLIGVRTADGLAIYAPFYYPPLFTCAEAAACDEVGGCVDGCDADDVGASLCALLGGGWEPWILNGTQITLTETGANVWTGSTATADGLGTIDIQLQPFSGNGGDQCGLWSKSVTLTHPDDWPSGIDIVENDGINGHLRCDLDPIIVFSGEVNISLDIYDDECPGDGSGSGGGGDCTSVEIDVENSGWGSECGDGDTFEIECNQTVQTSGATGAWDGTPPVFGLTWHTVSTFGNRFVSNDLGIDATPVMLVWTAQAGPYTFDLVDENNFSLTGGGLNFTGVAECFPDGSFVIDGQLEIGGGSLASGTINIVIEGQ